LETIELLNNRIRELGGTSIEDNMRISKLLGDLPATYDHLQTMWKSVSKAEQTLQNLQVWHWMRSVSFVSDALSFCQMVQGSLNLEHNFPGFSGFVSICRNFLWFDWELGRQWEYITPPAAPRLLQSNDINGEIKSMSGRRLHIAVIVDSLVISIFNARSLHKSDISAVT
jgi:hypothetical protein